MVNDGRRWTLVLSRISWLEMPPPKDAELFPPPRSAPGRWTGSRLSATTRPLKNAGDPGIVLARRLSNAEYDYTIRDLTGVDIQPTREFPADPSNTAGF